MIGYILSFVAGGVFVFVALVIASEVSHRRWMRNAKRSFSGDNHFAGDPH